LLKSKPWLLRSLLVGDGPGEDWSDERDVRSKAPLSRATPLHGDKEPQSSLTNDPMTRLWQTADGRETGAEAVQAIRARRRNLRGRPEEKGRWWRRIWRGHLH
jgi:hypothetical protein